MDSTNYIQLAENSVSVRHFVDPVLSLSPVTQYARLPLLLEGFRRFAFAFIPDFLRRGEESNTVHLAPTAYLDGLRGLSALVVFNYHFLFAFTDATVKGFGASNSQWSIISLPFVRLLHDGACAVIIFFAVAGIVCSSEAQRLMTIGEYDKALRRLCGSVFRRVLRIFLPVLAITLVTTIATYLGIFEMLRPIVDLPGRPKYFPWPFNEDSPPRFDSLSAQLRFWLDELFRLGNFWHPKAYYPKLDPHLWSVAFEVRTSLSLYTALLGMTFFKPTARIISLVLLAILWSLWDRWEAPPFFVGAAMIQYKFLRLTDGNKTMQSLSATPKQPSRQYSVSRWLKILSYVAALYLMSWPPLNLKFPAPGFVFLNKCIPSWYGEKTKFYKSIGTTIFVCLLTTSCDNKQSLWCQILESRIAQFLGKRMFALYLVHGPLLHCFGYGVPHTVWSVIGNKNDLTWWLGVSTGWACSLAICVWAADIFTREVDARVVKFIRTAEKSLYSKS